MSPGQRETPATGTGAHNPSATTPIPDTPNLNRPKRPSQYDRVLAVLMSHDEVCGHRTFYGELRIPRFSVHIHSARRSGIVITKRPCDWHWHEGTAYLYRIEALPTLPGIAS